MGERMGSVRCRDRARALFRLRGSGSCGASTRTGVRRRRLRPLLMLLPLLPLPPMTICGGSRLGGSVPGPDRLALAASTAMTAAEASAFRAANTARRCRRRSRDPLSVRT